MISNITLMSRTQLVFDISPKSAVFAKLIKVFHMLTGVKWGFVGTPGRCKYITSLEITIRVGIKKKKNIDLYVSPEILSDIDSAWAKNELRTLLSEKTQLLVWTPPDDVQLMIDDANEQLRKHPISTCIEKDIYRIRCDEPIKN